MPGQPAIDATLKFKFQDETRARGICPEHFSPSGAGEPQGPGVAAGDFDNDGFVDLYIPQGFNTDVPPAPVRNLLYHNQQDGTFVDIGEQAGVGPLTSTTAALWIDYDNDGWLDLFVVNGDASQLPGGVNPQPYYLYRNQWDEVSNCLNTGNCFADVTAGIQPTTASTSQLVRALAAGDLNNDGYIDIFLNDDVLFINQGNGTFVQVPAGIGAGDSGIEGPSNPWQCIIADFNNDGWQDIYQNTDGPYSPNLLWLNQQSGYQVNPVFSEGFNCCTAQGQCSNSGATNDCLPDQYLGDAGGTDMGVALGDWDNDGDLDAVTANFTASDLISLWMAENDGDGDSQTSHDSVAGGVGGTSWTSGDLKATVAPFVGNASLKGGWNWGVTFLDANNDGYLDLAVTNGFDGFQGVNSCFDESVFQLNERNASGTWADKSAEVGFNDTNWGVSLIAADFDRNGAIDTFQTGNTLGLAPRCPDNGPFRLRHNYVSSGNTNKSLLVRPRSYGCNHFAVGAIVRIKVYDDQPEPVVLSEQMRLITAGTSFIGQEPAEAFFGMGPDANSVDIFVEWPATGTAQGQKGQIAVTSSLNFDVSGLQKYFEVDIARHPEEGLLDCDGDGIPNGCEVDRGAADVDQDGVPDDCPACPEPDFDSTGLTVEWVGPITGPPVEGIDQDYVVTLDANCVPSITLRTTEVGTVAVDQWLVGRNLDLQSGDDPGPIGTIDATWIDFDPQVATENVKIVVGSQTIPARKAKSLEGIQTPAPLEDTFLNIELVEILEDVTGLLLAHADSANAGGRIKGDVKGAVSSITAYAIGDDNALTTDDTLKMGRLTDAAADITLEEHPANSVLELSDATATHTGDIIVSGSIDGPLTIKGCFAGNLCGSNLQNWTPGTSVLPSNIDVAFGPGATICGANACPGVTAATPESTVIAKNRFLTFQHPSPSTNTAIGVLAVNVDGFPEANGNVYWVGPSTTFRNPPPLDTAPFDFDAAQLECTPLYSSSWPNGDIHIYGPEIVPGSLYHIWVVTDSGDTDLKHCGLAVSTGKWGDVVTPFDPIGSQPTFGDVTILVDTFKGLTTSLPLTRGLLIPNLLDPEDDKVDFMEISAVVDAFKGVSFVSIDGITGPCPCPAPVCGTTCEDDEECDGGLCVQDGQTMTCLDACGRCTPQP